MKIIKTEKDVHCNTMRQKWFKVAYKRGYELVNILHVINITYFAKGTTQDDDGKFYSEICAIVDYEWVGESGNVYLFKGETDEEAIEKLVEIEKFLCSPDDGIFKCYEEEDEKN